MHGTQCPGETTTTLRVKTALCRAPGRAAGAAASGLPCAIAGLAGVQGRRFDRGAGPGLRDLPDSYLREIAEHFSRQRPPFAASVDGADSARGQALVTAGDPQKGVPACVACHGSGLTGMEPGIPGLVGLRPTHIVAQLTRWRVGERRGADAQRGPGDDGR